MAKTPQKGPSPKDIVAKWQERLETRLKPWHLAPNVAKKLGPKLRSRIQGLTTTKKAVFAPADMKNSLRVAGDIARICKILQPAPHPKEIRFDTFQRVLSLCAKSHKVCQGPAGGGGWCDV
jgi:hypothetical protein